ncbi:MAG: hypothetical protein C0409_00850 [Novosphingobium sp.]|nr:hypothetical protein [Novosphingobium sp.]
MKAFAISTIAKQKGQLYSLQTHTSPLHPTQPAATQVSFPFLLGQDQDQPKGRDVGFATFVFANGIMPKKRAALRQPLRRFGKIWCAISA